MKEELDLELSCLQKLIIVLDEYYSKHGDEKTVLRMLEYLSDRYTNLKQ